MFKSILYLLLLICLCESITVKTKLGEINGAERISRGGKTYYAFTGVPYAEPPVGKLRLKNPVPVEPWVKTLDATKESPKCLQVRVYEHFLRNLTFGQEDCLYLSIYTPDLKPKEKLAVLVQTHGGGFRCGDAGPKDNPDYLMDADVILVNVHYRLGVLGFLSTEDHVIPGNFGLKDQSMALHWVKENIKAFGGDDERITVFGESAGGASAHYHMVSPMSKGIIRGAISQSGSINKVWSFRAPGESLPLAKRVAELVDCGDKAGDDLLDCLQKACPTQLIRTELDFLYWDFEPAVIFRPVQEPLAEGAFITFDPMKQETTLPWITGVVSREGAFKVASLLSQGDSLTQQFIDNMDEYLMKILAADETCPKAKQTVQLLKERYFPEPITIKSAVEGLDYLFADTYIIFPMADALRRHKGPVYEYYYDYRAGGSLTDLYGGNLGDLGVCHADDLLTLFNFKEFFPKTNPDEEEVSKTMVRLWTNFAKYQKPTLPEDKVQWPKYNSMGQYLHITNDLSVKRHLKADVLDWWFNLPLFSNSQDRTEL